MAWTIEAKLESAMRLPWTITTQPGDEPGEIVIRVKELPGMILVGTDAEIEAQFWPALRASLSAMLQFGDKITPPAGQQLPWEAKSQYQSRLAVVGKQGDAWHVEPAQESTSGGVLVVQG